MGSGNSFKYVLLDLFYFIEYDDCQHLIAVISDGFEIIKTNNDW